QRLRVQAFVDNFLAAKKTAQISNLDTASFPVADPFDFHRGYAGAGLPNLLQILGKYLTKGGDGLPISSDCHTLRRKTLACQDYCWRRRVLPWQAHAYPFREALASGSPPMFV